VGSRRGNGNGNGNPPTPLLSVGGCNYFYELFTAAPSGHYVVAYKNFCCQFMQISYFPLKKIQKKSFLSVQSTYTESSLNCLHNCRGRHPGIPIPALRLLFLKL